jgi:hypothetical protein
MEGKSKGKGQAQAKGAIYVVAPKDVNYAHAKSTQDGPHGPSGNEMPHCKTRLHMWAPLSHEETEEVDRPRIHVQSGPPLS